ncbi:MAG: 4Fe-4S binding protein [Dehalococcoidia bacterium]|nr:4Fe-4S binding protein [Dehalococcoidia bacterium]
MSSATISSEEVKAFAGQAGVDCVGIAGAEALQEQSIQGRGPVAVLPGARSVVIFGIAMLSASLRTPNERIVSSDIKSIAGELNTMGFRVARFLERKGYDALPCTPNLSLELTRETRGMLGDISLKHAAVAAGLGTWGRDRLVVTPRWGPRVRFAAVVTTAPLAVDSALGEELCNNCDLCIAACPSKAISEDNKVDTIKCLLQSQKYGRPHYFQFFSELFSKPPEEQQKAVRSPLFWNLMQDVAMGGTYSCFKCLEVCPVGR